MTAAQTGKGSIVQMEKEKPKGKCRKWKLVVSLGRDARTGIELHHLTDYKTINFIAKKSWDRKKNRWGWRVTEIID